MTVPTYRDTKRMLYANRKGPFLAAAEAGEVNVVQPGAEPLLPGLSSCGYWSAKRPQKWGLPLHYDEGFEIAYLERGSLVFRDDRDVYELDSQSFTITRPWQPHAIGDPFVGSSKLCWIMIDVGVRKAGQPWRWPDWIILTDGDRKELADRLEALDRTFWPTPSGVAHVFRKLAEDMDGISRGDSASKLAIHINELLAFLLAELRSGTLSVQRRSTIVVERAKAFLQKLPERIAQKWTLGDMAASSRLGITSFCMACKELTNMAPLEHLRMLRLDRAVGLLNAKPEKSITDIAVECGFSSSQYFSTVFRKRFGFSPSQYRDL